MSALRKDNLPASKAALEKILAMHACAAPDR